MQTYQKITFRETQAELVEAPLPEPGENEVLIRSRCSLISPGTEKAALKRLWDDAEFRASPGYALAGAVVAVGRQESALAAASALAPGDRVISLAPHGSYALASAEPWVTLKIPGGLSDERATFVVLASVALHALRRAQIGLGDPLVILGAGLVGQLALQLAILDGARQVIVIDLAENRLELARRSGAGLVINPAREDPVERVFAATGGRGAPFILEAAGNPQVIPLAFQLAASGGRIVLTGALEEPVTLRLHAEFIRRELSLIAAFQPFNPVQDNLYWRWTQPANRRFLLDLLAEGKLHVDELITHRFPAGRAPEAYEHIKAGDTGMLGILLDWEQ